MVVMSAGGCLVTHKHTKKKKTLHLWWRMGAGDRLVDGGWREGVSVYRSVWLCVQEGVIQPFD